jgi:hypothetical protein
MFLSKLVVKWLEWIIEVGLWLTLVAAFVGGLRVGDGFFGSLLTAVISTVMAGVFASLVFGGFIILADIRRLLTEIRSEKVGS